MHIKCKQFNATNSKLFNYKRPQAHPHNAPTMRIRLMSQKNKSLKIYGVQFVAKIFEFNACAVVNVKTPNEREKNCFTFKSKTLNESVQRKDNIFYIENLAYRSTCVLCCK